MRALLALALLTPFAVSAADLDCSVKAKKMTKDAELKAMAKISADDARKAATGAVTVSGATIDKGELEVEDGCLVYTYDVKVPGKILKREVYVDAGNGKVLKNVSDGGSGTAKK